jgi:tRNA 2-selenouridine synthase
MENERIDIENFIELSNKYPVFDVRSPSEFSHAHIPGANSLPLFTDEQRKVIGTAYKQQGRQVALNIGLNYFSERMKSVPDEVEKVVALSQKKRQHDDISCSRVPILVHCWRGGMRSNAVSWLLSLFGFKVCTLKGGYKSFRSWAITQFAKEYSIRVIGGFTGSGKTALLRQMKFNGRNVIDLEALANHKGSAFGGIGQRPQPRQEMFENLLAVELYNIAKVASATNGVPYTKISPV